MKDSDALGAALQLIGFAAKRGAFSHIDVAGLQKIEAIEQHLAGMAQRTAKAEAALPTDKPCKGCKKKKG